MIVRRLVTFLMLIGWLSAFAKISASFSHTSLPDALKSIELQAKGEIIVNFSYEKLEDYMVSTEIKGLDPLEAINLVVGFYPIKITVVGKVVMIQPIFETSNKVIGRLVNEDGEGVDFANISVFSLPDTAYLASGLTTENGDFVIPTSSSPHQILLRINRLGYLPALVQTMCGNVGYLIVHTNPELLDELEVTEKSVPKLWAKGGRDRVQRNR